MTSHDPMDREALQLRMKKLFMEGFTVLDIAEPLLSFDAVFVGLAGEDLCFLAGHSL